MQAIGKIIEEISKKYDLGDPAAIKQKVLADSDIQAFIKENQARVNAAMIERSMANLYKFYSQKYGQNKAMAGYQAELFLNNNVIDVTYKPTAAKIASDHEKSTKKHLQLIDLPQNLHDVRLSQVDITQGRSEAIALISHFLDKYGEKPHQKGLYLSGNFGVGKTYLLAGLANQVAAMGKNVIFLHVPTFIAGLSSHFEDNSLQDEIKRVADCDLLILDDIGAETLSQWSRDDVLGVILQARMDKVLPTFFSSNLAMKDLEDHFKETKNAIDPVKAARLMERVRFLAKEVVVAGENRRR
ncbi:primosomal protein DnaI [Lactobacillus sp. ESL0791]|uniref:primosomal protein DnaI n=1 Tax=Lactobacillus sp. ESL0791 TaxID=2983234 RepID=UPI0023F92D28|nr:primosomal protein DnaI [Lactobacillus sp. ESL0791]MDF7639180.1 primosomal protein DnaI [Lactobacillus sp. ESL0791]